MAKIVFIGTVNTLGTTGNPPDEVRRYINPDNIITATVQKTEKVWVWSFKMSDGTSLNSMAFDDYDDAISWAVKHKIVEMN